jgi:hypothetical protein
MSTTKNKTLSKCEELIDRLTELKKVINALSDAQPSRPGRPSVNKSFNKSSEPATKYTPAQLAAIAEANRLKKNAENAPWTTHNRVPNADAEVKNLQRTNPVAKAEDIMATQLANMMAGKAMLGIKPPVPLSGDAFIKAGEQMGLAPSEEQLQKAEHDWNNRFDWLAEAQKPISSRFKTPEEEQAYWDSIKVRDRDDGKPGF